MTATGSRQRVGTCGCVFFAALAACSSVWADSTTVALTDASTVSTSAPITLQFPVTRTGDIGYEAILRYHTADGTALAGVDYTAVADDATIPAGATTANIPVTIAANPGPGASKTFQLVVDSIVGVGPQADFAAHYEFATGLSPRCVRVADINADGKPDLIVADTGANTVTVLLNSTVPGSTTPTFSTGQSFATGVQPYSIVIVDINGDGRPDVVAANYGSNSVSVLLNTTVAGAAQPTFVVQHAFAAGANPISVDAADINSDGRPDLIVANHSSNTVSVLLNNTPPGAAVSSFGAPQNFDAGNTPFFVVAADINGDGRPDVVVADYADNLVAVLLNMTVPRAVAAGFATKQTFATGAQPISVSAADINGDGKPELIVANYAEAAVSVLVNDTAPGATTPAFAAQQKFATKGFPISVAAVDFNGDGKPELIAGIRGSTSISILRNTTVPGSAARFSAEQTFAGADRPVFVTAADINGDGKPDLIAANFYTSSVSVLVNTVTTPVSRDFASAQTFAAGTNPSVVAQADLNGDDKPDLVVVNSPDNTVSVLLNNTPVGAMTQSFTAQQTFATGSSPNSVAIADVDGDGKPDLVVANSGSDDTVSVLFNTTATGAMTASFAAQQTVAAVSPWSLIAVDINGDDKPDLAYVNGGYGAVLINTTVSGSMTASFAAQQTFGTGGGAIIASDINGDGKPDLVEASGNGIAVLLNTTPAGAPTASFAAQQTFPTGLGGISVVAVDVNRDGKPDLAASSVGDNSYQSNHVSVLLNITPTGAQTPAFAARQDFDSGSYPTFLSAADINGDGALDLVVTNGEGASIMLNNTPPAAAAPSFATPSITGAQMSAVIAADMNGDGKSDLIGVTAAGVAVQLNTTVSQTAFANFSARQEIASIASAANCCRPSVATADINRDGRPDVITVDGGYAGGQFAVLLNTTLSGAISPSFGLPETFPIAGVVPESVAIADINGDGLPDVITANSNSGGVSVALNTTPAGAATATFSAPLTFTLGDCTDSVFAADLNGDGRPDLMVGDCGFSASVLINTTLAGASAPSFAVRQPFFTTGDGSVIATDLNGDGKRDLLGVYVDAVALVNTTAPGSTSASFAAPQDVGTVSGNGGQLIATDLNGDGKPDIAAAPTSNFVKVFLNSTSPGSATVGFVQTDYTFSTGLDGYVSSVVGADLDGDGRTDLITDDMLDNTASVLLNTTPPGATTASFVWQHAMDAGYFPVSTAIADINGDGKPDLLTTHYENGVISVLLNTQYQTIISGSPAIGTIVPDDIFANGFD